MCAGIWEMGGLQACGVSTGRKILQGGRMVAMVWIWFEVIQTWISPKVNGTKKVNDVIWLWYWGCSPLRGPWVTGRVPLECIFYKVPWGLKGKGKRSFNTLPSFSLPTLISLSISLLPFLLHTHTYFLLGDQDDVKTLPLCTDYSISCQTLILPPYHTHRIISQNHTLVKALQKLCRKAELKDAIFF